MMLNGVGKLYTAYKDELITTVDYRLHLESSREGLWDTWSGELVLSDSRRINEGSGYLLELEDERKGRCSLRKKVNKAVMGVPPRYFYHVNGTGPLGRDENKGDEVNK